MKKIYLVDSENVGDIWVPLLAASQDEEQVLVFYTQKSPHMSYENLRLLKETEKEAVFVKCFEGNNALDFQLVTELGYRLKGDTDCSYVIVSNDTGFDAVVRYWGERNMPVSRLSGKDCARQLSGIGAKKRNMPAPKETEPEEKVAETQECVTVSDDIQKMEETPAAAGGAVLEPESEGALSGEVETVVEKLCCCISKEKLADFHNALVAFFGEDEGKALYQVTKTDPKWNMYWSGVAEYSQEEKFDIYCKMVFAHSELADDYPEDFASFLCKAGGKRKNLNSLRAVLQGHYGKDKGMKYYSLIKSHVKIMNRM